MTTPDGGSNEVRGGIRNLWYPVLPGAELADTPAPLRRLGEDLVAWRDEHGRPHVFRDCCPHRSAPLSLGAVTGSRLRCGYHGLEFDGTGRCRRVPFDRVDDGPHCEPFQARSYPCEERAGYLWCFVDDETQAAAVPPLELEPEIASDEFEWFLTTVDFRSNWLTVLENQCDPGHTAVLHGDAPFLPPDERQVLDWFVPDPLPFRTEEIPRPSGEGTRPSVLLVAPSPYGGGEPARYIPPTLVKIPVQLPDAKDVTWVLQYHTPVDETATIGYWCTSRRVRSEPERDEWRAQWPLFAAVWQTIDDQDARICEALDSRARERGRALPQDGGFARVRRLLRQLSDAADRS